MFRLVAVALALSLVTIACGASRSPSPTTAAAPAPAVRCADSGEHCQLCRPNGGARVLASELADRVTLPAEAAILSQASGGSSPRDLEYAIALDDLHALAPADHAALQAALGFAESPLLFTHASWKAAAPIGAPQQFPALPACRAIP